METSDDRVGTKLVQDSLACDCLLSLFWAAMNSYRHDNLLRPYPPMFATAESKQISDLVCTYITIGKIFFLRT